MIKNYRKTIHIRLESEEIIKIINLAKCNRTDNFSALLYFLANYPDYDLVMQGEPTCFGNDCIAATCLYNGGEAEVLINSHQARRLMHEATVVLAKSDFTRMIKA